MKRTLKVLLGAAALAVIGVSSATAQTGSLLGKNLFLFDGGTGAAQNQVQLIAPADATLITNWTMTLPPNAGGPDFILVNTDGLGTTQWTDGNSIFWRLDGNTGTTPWDGTNGNYYGTGDATDLALRSGGTSMAFWFQNQSFPRFTMNSFGQTTIQTSDGYQALTIGGTGPNGPDAGIVLDCAFPPTVGMEVNALATGILMPTCATAPLVGISVQAQTTGLEITATPTALFVSGATTALDVSGTTALDATGNIYLNSIAADPTDTRILSIDAATGLVSYRTLAATGSIVTTPTGGTVDYLPLWRPTGTELGTSIVSQDFPATTATINGAAVVTGQSDLRGNLINTTGDLTLLDGNINVNATGAGTVAIGSAAAGNVTIASGATTQIGGPDIYLNPTAANDLRININLANDETDTRILTQDAASGVISYRSISGTGSVVTGSGTPNQLTRWGATTGTLVDASLSDDGAGLLARAGNIQINPGAGATLSTNGSMSVGVNLAVTGTSDLRGNVINTTGDLTLLDGNINVNATGAGTVAIGSAAAGNVTVASGATTQIGGPDIYLNPTAANDLRININLANDETDTRILTQDAASGVISYRSISGTGSVVTGSGTPNQLTRWGATTGTLVDASLSDDGAGLLARAGNVQINTGGANTLSTNGSFTADGSVTLGNAAADVITLSGSTVDITNVPTTANSTNLLRRNASGDIEVSNLTFATIPGGSLTPLRNVRTDAAGGLTVGAIALNGGANEVTGVLPIANGGTNSGTALNNNRIMVSSVGAIVEAAALTDGQLLIGSTGAAPVAANITSSGGTITVTNGAGSIGLAVTNPVPAGTTTNATLRWSGTAWVENTLFRADVAGGLFNNSLASGASTDNLLTIDAAGNFRETSVTTMIGGLPWILGGNTTGVTGANNILGINYASGQTLQLFVQGFQAAEFATTGALTQNFDFTARENVTLGDADDDNHAIRGDLDINNTNGAALNVNINTSAFANVTTIGSITALNTTSINSPVVNAPNLPTGAAGNALITTDGTQLFETTPTQLFGGLPWVIGGNVLTAAGTFGSTSAHNVNLVTNNNTHISLIQSTQATDINVGATSGDVTIGLNGQNEIQLNSDIINAPNLPNASGTATTILMWESGQIVKKDLGTPVQKSKTAQAMITGAPPTRVFTISDTFVATGATITLTLQDGTDLNDYTVTLPAANIVNNVSFSIRLSGVVGAGLTKYVHYTITNP